MSDNTYPLIAVLVIPDQPTRRNNLVFITGDKKEVYHRAAFSLSIYKHELVHALGVHITQRGEIMSFGRGVLDSYPRFLKNTEVVWVPENGLQALEDLLGAEVPRRNSWQS